MFFELTGTSQCRRCGPYEGMIVSNIEDEAVAYGVEYAPDVESRGPFHDSCQHNWAETGPPGTPVDGKRYSEDELAGISRYQNASADINTALRTGGLDDEQKLVRDRLDAAFARTPRSTTEQILYRGITKKEYGRIENAALKGKVYTDRGYVSTTTNVATADEFAGYYATGGRARKITIIAPEGTVTLPVDELARDLGTFEQLLPRGTRFQPSFAANKLDLILTVLP